MSSHPPLRELVRSIVSDKPSQLDTRRFVQVCYDLARAYLKVTRKRFLLSDVILANPEKDLALDAIAELFERNSDGQFVRLQKAYAAANWSDLGENSLWTATRRIVCGEVSDSLFKFYRMADTSLAKIIRNLKRAVNDNLHLELHRAFGQIIISLRGERVRKGQSVTPEMLESWLSQRLQGSYSLQNISDVLVLFLEHTSDHCSGLSLSMTAVCIRNVTVRLQIPLADEKETISLLNADEFTREINFSVSKILDDRRPFYISRNRLTRDEYSAIGRAVNIRLQSFFNSTRTDTESNYEACRMEFDNLSKAEYRRRYRNVFEYLFQLSRAELIKRVSLSMEYSAESAYGND